VSNFKTRTSPYVIDTVSKVYVDTNWDHPPYFSIGSTGAISTRTDSVTADYPIRWDFQRRINERRCATTDMSGFQSGLIRVSDLHTYLNQKRKTTKLKRSQPPKLFGECFYKDKWTNLPAQYRGFEGPYPWPSSIGTGFTDSLSVGEQLAKKRFNEKILKAQRDLCGLTALGELRDTISLIRHPAKAFRRGLDEYLLALKNRLRGIRYDARKKRTQVVSDTWLEYAFGWKPLCSDIEEGIQSLNRYLYQRMPSEFIGANGSDFCRIRSPAGTSSFSNMTSKNDGVIQLGYSEWKLYGVVSVENNVGRAFPSFGISFLEVVPTVWELIPYSFLVDYFTNVGDIFSAFSINRSNIRWVSYGTCQLRARHGVGQRIEFPSPMPSAPDYVYDHGDHEIRPAETYAYIEITKSRGTYSIYNPYVDFSFEIPGLSTKWINMSALLFSRDKLLRR